VAEPSHDSHMGLAELLQDKCCPCRRPDDIKISSLQQIVICCANAD